MGPAGIVAQAPFVAASSALPPVVAPVMLFMTVSSVITGARLDRVQQALGSLSENLRPPIPRPFVSLHYQNHRPTDGGRVDAVGGREDGECRPTVDPIRTLARQMLRPASP